jgi:hypothetical protein
MEKHHPVVDVFRQRIRSQELIPVTQTLQDYRYSICIENYVDERYFTEKILNCLASGTIPIYLGARKISHFFNPDGLITFSSYYDLVNRVLPTIGQHDYESRLEAVEGNFQKVLEYRSIEDYIYSHYSSEIVNALK